jgi:hypothetical protein
MTLTRMLLAALVAAPAKAKPKLFSWKTAERDTWPQWADDRLGYWPTHDRGGAMSEYAGSGDDGMLGILAQIERNEEDGRKDLGHGLPPDALQPRSA